MTVVVNVNRFIAPTINPAHLPLPNAIEDLDQEAILAARMADFQARADQAGFAYDVGDLEFDPIKIDQEAHAHRETLMRARVNSAVRAVLPAYAQGNDLDAIAARANVQRLVIEPATLEAPAVMETDTALLLRYLTSFAVPAAGSADAYVYHGVKTWPQARDIAVLGPGVHGVPGRAAVYLLGSDGTPAADETCDRVREALHAPNAKPLTDIVTVAPAEIIPYEIALTITLPRGPAPAVIAKAAEEQIRKAAEARYAIGATVYANAIEGAAYVGNVLRVRRTAPDSDIVVGPSQAAFCMQITITVEVEP
jgi:phage-related baseplate assembly protein